MYPTLPPLPDGETGRVPGALLVRGDCDDHAWNDVLARMGELPGMVAHTSGQPLPLAQGPMTRRLLVVQDPAWRGADPAEVAQALDGTGAWVPDLVLIADRGTTRDSDLRPLMAFRPSDDELYRFRVTPRQAAMTYLVVHRPSIEHTLDHHAKSGAAEIELDPGESYEDWVDSLPEPMGDVLETAASPPRYQPPPAPLPVITQNDGGLLVRTDFSDDHAWAALVADADRPDPWIETPEDHQSCVQIVDDPAFAGATPEQVMAIVRQNEDEENGGTDVVVIADRASMGGSDRSVLAVPLEDDVGWSFRLSVENVGSMAVNLFLANTGIEDWMNHLPDGPAVITEKEMRSVRGW